MLRFGLYKLHHLVFAEEKNKEKIHYNVDKILKMMIICIIMYIVKAVI